MTGTLDPTSGRQAHALPLSDLEEWLNTLRGPGEIGGLLSRPWEEQLRLGYGHTLREIAQQPVTWLETTARLRGERPPLSECLRDVQAVVFTGSGSSVYAAECVAPWLQAVADLPVSAVPAGFVLTHPESSLPPSGRFLVVSVARSGDSPESRAAVDWLLESRPQARHLFITCNRAGALATAYGDRGSVRAVVLDDRTNDRSLVMTSSFTNLVLAARSLAGGAQDEEERSRRLAQAGAELLRDHADALAAVARSGFCSVVYLGSGCRLGSAREAALKMLETNAGEVWTMAESFLGLRHGPMSAIRRDTLVVAFLSSDPQVRPYELDLLTELDRKGLGCGRVVLGAGLPSGPGLRVDCAAAAACDDSQMAVLDAVCAQLLAFFRCLHAGHRPDAPSEASVITRVVSDFQIHSRSGGR
ncbi:MAG TPA: tagatose-6-phosphate ketose isomerase [Vicinamibacteria bacterium]|nr:tagatose-6-phosphate ketose isomerase [Vicinamibacteria bacterium]